MQDVTNPGLVNVSDQGDGLVSVDQPVTTGPSTNPGPVVQSSGRAPGAGVPSSQTVGTGPSQTADLTVQAGTYSPQSPNTVNTTEDTVINQIYGQGAPINVYV
jgi:hypothetical protein